MEDGALAPVVAVGLDTHSGDDVPGDGIVVDIAGDGVVVDFSVDIAVDIVMGAADLPRSYHDLGAILVSISNAAGVMRE